MQNIRLGEVAFKESRIMKLEMLAIGNYASNNQGHLTIVETFDALKADKFPWRAYFGVAAKVRFDEGESRKNFSIIIKSADVSKKPIFQVESEAPLSPGGKLVMAGNIKGLVFEEAGMYKCILKVDGNEVGDCAFSVRLDGEEKLHRA